MNITSTFFEGWKRIFTGKNIGMKHLCLFILSAIISGLFTRLNLINETVKVSNILPDMSFIGWGALFAVIIWIFLTGYSFIFMHNCFDENSENLLPDFSLNAFKVFWNCLPLLIVWFLYIVIAAIIGIVLLLNQFTSLLGLIIIAFTWFIIAFIQYVYVMYCENYETKGLFSVLIPFKCLRYSLGEMIVIWLLAISSYILAFIPLVVFIIILTLAGVKGDGVSYVSSIIGGYFALVMRFVWNYCLVKIYIEKIKSCLGLETFL